MNSEQVKNYLRSSGMSDEQISSVMFPEYQLEELLKINLEFLKKNFSKNHVDPYTDKIKAAQMLSVFCSMIEAEGRRTWDL